MRIEIPKRFGSVFPLANLIFLLDDLNAEKSISNPLRNIRKIKPSVERMSNHDPPRIKSKPLFPIINPIIISAMTTGINEIRKRSRTIGVKKAKISTITSESNDSSIKNSPILKYELRGNHLSKVRVQLGPNIGIVRRAFFLSWLSLD